MVALLHPPIGSSTGRPGRLQLVVDNTSRNGDRSAVSDGIVAVRARIERSSLRTLDLAMVVGVMVAAVVILGGLFMVRVAQGSAPADSWVGVERSVPATPVVVAQDAHVVMAKPGDSMWSVAQELAPNSDPRPVVAALIEANGGESLQIGQQIVIPKQLLD